MPVFIANQKISTRLNRNKDVKHEADSNGDILVWNSALNLYTDYPASIDEENPFYMMLYRQ